MLKKCFLENSWTCSFLATFYKPIFPNYVSWKQQKNLWFSDFSGIEKEYRSENGQY